MWLIRARGGYSGLGAESKKPSIRLAGTYPILALSGTGRALGEMLGLALLGATDCPGVAILLSGGGVGSTSGEVGAGATVDTEGGTDLRGEAALGSGETAAGAAALLKSV